MIKVLRCNFIFSGVDTKNSGIAELINKEFTVLMGDTKYVIYRKWNKNLIVSLPQFFINVEKIMILLFALSGSEIIQINTTYLSSYMFIKLNNDP